MVVSIAVILLFWVVFSASMLSRRVSASTASASILSMLELKSVTLNGSKVPGVGLNNASLVVEDEDISYLRLLAKFLLSSRSQVYHLAEALVSRS